MDNALLFCRKDAAAMLAISIRSLDYLLADGRLKAQRMGRKVVIRHKEIERVSKSSQTRRIRPLSKKESQENTQPPVESPAPEANKGTDEEAANG